jgi:hypothetical protein
MFFADVSCYMGSTVLQDEDISHQIQAKLADKTKHGLIKVTDFINVISSPKTQDHLKLVGINRPFISKCMGHHWLGTLKWQYGRQTNGMYINGHECKDVVQYRTAFVQRFKQHKTASTSGMTMGRNSHPPMAFIFLRPLAVFDLSS